MRNARTESDGHLDVPLFLDEESAMALDWAAIWAQFQPVTVYGMQLKQRAMPYLPGQEAQWQAELAELSGDLASVPAPVIERIRNLLRHLPDVREALAQLGQTEAVLSPKQLLALKQLAWSCVVLAETEGVRDWMPAAAWRVMLRPFGQPQVQAFAIEHVAGDAYRAMQRQYASLQGELAAATRQRDDALFEQTGVRPNRDGLLILPVPGCRQLANRLKESGEVRWLRDTPFESVFEVAVTAGMESKRDAIVSCRRSLDDMEQAALRKLTRDLRADREDWLAGIAQIARLDWRMAKLVPVGRWEASVPRAGAQIALEGGVHPLVSERLARAGGRFVPIAFGPDAGVNVLCGSNMGGKTVAMSLLCVCQVLAQYALPVPASGFVTGLVDGVRFLTAADTDAANGLSSFGNEMTRLSRLWREVEEQRRMLVCLDEPARSTNPVEGEAIVAGLLHALRGLSAAGRIVVIVATHFAGPAADPDVSKFRVRGLRAEVLDGETIDAADRLQRLEAAMDYRIERAEQHDAIREGLKIARWLGLPDAILGPSEAFLQRGKRL